MDTLSFAWPHPARGDRYKLIPAGSFSRIERTVDPKATYDLCESRACEQRLV